MIIDSLKCVSLNLNLELLNNLILEKPESAIYRKIYGEGGNKNIFAPNSFNSFFGVESSFGVPVLNLGRVRVRDLERELQRFDVEKIKSVSRKIGKEYLTYGVPQKILPKEFDKSYRTSMNFLGVMLGVMDSTEKFEKGFAKYSYESEQYPFREGSLSERSIWSFAQGAASVIHSGDRYEVEMYAKIIHSPDKVIIESRKKEDWGLENSSHII